jgi:predicted aldo/keto reductase-like oxidoreductase
MSDTPRTDEAQFGTGRVSVDFARQLERELAAANAKVKRLEEAGDWLIETARYYYERDKNPMAGSAIANWTKSKETRP